MVPVGGEIGDRTVIVRKIASIHHEDAVAERYRLRLWIIRIIVTGPVQRDEKTEREFESDRRCGCRFFSLFWNMEITD